MKVKKLKIKRTKAKLTLVGWSVISALVLTLFLSLVTVDVDPSFFDSQILNQKILGAEQTLYRVVRVVDGDTFVVERNGVEKTVRLLGIDTPETRHPQQPVECFGIEASRRLYELLDNQYVRLEGDITQADNDRYGRILRYVYLPDDTFVNELMLREGYAFEYTYERPYEHAEKFIAAEDRARELGRGLWSENACGVDGQ